MSVSLPSILERLQTSLLDKQEKIAELRKTNEDLQLKLSRATTEAIPEETKLAQQNAEIAQYKYNMATTTVSTSWLWMYFLTVNIFPECEN